MTRRNSKKRQAILDALCATKEHPSAEQLYAQLKPEYPDLSLGTVYRNLGVLLEDGAVISVGKVNGEDRFDADISSHAHFVCTECGAVIDIPIDEKLLPAYSMIEEQTSGRVTFRSLIYNGLCKACCSK